MIIDIPKGQWFRFSLRTLFILFTAVAIWLGWNAFLVQRRAEVTNFITNFGSGTKITYGEPIRSWKGIPVIWRLLRVRPIKTIELTGTELCDILTEDDRQTITLEL